LCGVVGGPCGANGGPVRRHRRPARRSDPEPAQEGARMGMLCAVSFNRYGRLYYLDPGEPRPAVGDRVLVPTDDGPVVGECVWAAQWVDEDTSGFPRLLGLASEEDLARDELIRKRKAEA